MRFRTSGRNWEGRDWVLAPCLVTLATQIDALHPARHAADGTVASKTHDQNNPNSDHRPRPFTGKGTVRAIDFGETTEDDAFKICESLRLSRDPRIKYVIHERRLFSSYPTSTHPPFTWRPYSLSPHLDHGHLSSLATSDADTRPWTITQGDDDMASPGQKLMVDLAFNLFPNELQGDPAYWLDLDENSPEWDQAFRPALSRGAQRLYQKVSSGGGTHHHDGRYIKDISIGR